MKVLKFGGTSVAKPERIQHILSIVLPRIEKGEKLTLVCSALGGVTDQLIDMIDTAGKGDESYIKLVNHCRERHYETVKALLHGEDRINLLAKVDVLFLKLENILKGIFFLKEASGRSYDYVMSFGERLSNLIIANYFTSQNIPSIFVDARGMIVTDSEFRSAKVFTKESYENIRNTFAKNPDKTHIVTGFIAADKADKTTTLGRGGSDYTAALLAAAVDAQALEIWTDVDGVLTTNPKVVKTAFPIKEMSFIEAMEMSHFGAKVIYPPTIQPVHEKGIPTYIRNTFNPEYSGTRIHNKSSEKSGSIKGLSSLNEITLITLTGTGMQGVPGISGRLFGCLAQHKISVILITQASSEHSICFAIAENMSKLAVQVLQSEFSREIEAKQIENIVAEDEICIIAAVGEAMKNQPGIAGKLFSTLGRNGINIEAIAQGSSELNISFAIHQKDEEKALNLIHDTFFNNTIKTLNLFLVGTGLIGGTLLEQLKEFKQEILKDRGIDLKIIGISNSRKMIFDNNGLNLDQWKELISNSKKTADPNLFVQKLIECNLANSVFIDNTASDLIPDFYSKILDNSIAICTPNKVASSSTLDNYNALKLLAKKRNTRFLTETNVGAGLPVISTIHTLLNSGDKITKIEAVLSGSLSYIFNNFTSKTKFKEIVEKAQQLGFTEPDPRDDLSGSDVRRKITILARESGYQIEQAEVNVKPILPKICLDQNSVEEFYQSLKEQDSYFAEMINQAETQHKRLRFIATFVDGKAMVGLEQVDQTSPFYNLSNSDNMISLYTKRYINSPLVISGPGAGANVTAAGVFAEIIQIANESFDY